MRWPSMSECGSCGAGAWGASGVVSVSVRNWSKRSGSVVRAGGICTCATASSGTKKVSRPLVRLSFRPTISQGSGSVCGVGAG